MPIIQLIHIKVLAEDLISALGGKGMEKTIAILLQYFKPLKQLINTPKRKEEGGREERRKKWTEGGRKREMEGRRERERERSLSVSLQTFTWTTWKIT